MVSLTTNSKDVIKDYFSSGSKFHGSRLRYHICLDEALGMIKNHDSKWVC